MNIEGYAADLPATDGDTAVEMASPLAGFLSHASLEAGDNQAQQGEDAVQLMTIHASKGLEFHVVFVTGLEEGLFPHENSIGTSVEGGDGSTVDGIEEERRLMYVAITRARQRLYISYAQQRMLHGQTRYNMRSRFIDELPDEAIKWLAAPKPSIPNQAWDHTETRWGSPGRFGQSQSFTKQQDLAVLKIQQQRAAWPYKIGQTVTHAKFGQGLVVNYEGQGGDLRIQINFGKQGMKWLVVSLAKLQAE